MRDLLDTTLGRLTALAAAISAEVATRTAAVSAEAAARASADTAEALARSDADTTEAAARLALAKARLHVAFRAANTATWTDMPAAVTVVSSAVARNAAADLTGLSECRCIVNLGTPGPAGSVMRVQYSLDGSTNWTDLTPNCSLASASVPQKSAWGAIPTAAKSDVFLRVVAEGGDGATDPTFAGIWLAARAT